MRCNFQCTQAGSDDRESKDVYANPGPSTRHPDLTLQIPPRPGGLSSSSSSAAAFLRALSFKKRMIASEGERSSLLNPDTKPPPESPASDLNWKRCTSLPVTPASYLSPQITSPASARTHSERQRTHVIASETLVIITTKYISH